jgi:hypothetical protein
VGLESGKPVPVTDPAQQQPLGYEKYEPNLFIHIGKKSLDAESGFSEKKMIRCQPENQRQYPGAESA